MSLKRLLYLKFDLDRLAVPLEGRRISISTSFFEAIGREINQFDQNSTDIKIFGFEVTIDPLQKSDVILISQGVLK